MSMEFGHEAGSVAGWRIDAWGAGPFEITARGKAFRFEDSDRFGPHLVKADGELRENPWPGGRSPFWMAHRCWVRQGRRLADDGKTCIWEMPRPTLWTRRGRDKIVVENGDEDGEWIEI